MVRLVEPRSLLSLTQKRHNLLKHTAICYVNNNKAKNCSSDIIFIHVFLLISHCLPFFPCI